jgi:hypothetical protein
MLLPGRPMARETKQALARKIVNFNWKPYTHLPFRSSRWCTFGAPMVNEMDFYWERGRFALWIQSDADSFPKQECIRRFCGIVVDSAVLEHAGGRGRPRSQRAFIFGTVAHAPFRSRIR